MAWEERARGGRYYIRKTWQNGRCVSEYVGTGPGAIALAHIDDLARERRAADRRRQDEARQQEEDLDAALDAVTEMARVLTTAALLVAGCHTHKGTWRRRHAQHEGRDRGA